MTTIAISGPPLSAAGRATFDALGAALGVSFQPRTFADDADVHGWMVLGADREGLAAIAGAHQPCYVVLAEDALCEGGTSSRLRFADSAELTAVLRGRDISTDDAIGARVLPPWIPDLTPLAFKDGSPVWGSRRRGEAWQYCVALPPPELEAGEPLFSVFSGQCLARLLPLVVFIRRLEEQQGWEPPPLQATFMVDDPNLHWISYGFIDYRELVRHAGAGSYHVSVATIPLDAWFTHPLARTLFRENDRSLSLLIHGNDHVSNELARPGSPDAMRRVLRQALGRVARMENRTRLEVARVMAPPHGACSERAIAAMAGLGFEAICVSRGSLRHHNDGADWLRTMGMRPCDTVAGLPVIPRFGLSRNCQNDIVVAALLRQPIVAMTHHQGMADGYLLLDEIASVVNSLGNVSWRGMQEISRSLYSHRRKDGVLWVRMWSRRVSVRVPPGTTHIRVDPGRASCQELSFAIKTAAAPQWRVISPSVDVPVQAGVTVDIASGIPDDRHVEAAGRGRRIGAVARRLLTEGRDRALPSIHYLTRKSRSPALT